MATSRADDVEAEVRQVYQAHFGRLAGWATTLVSDRELGHDLAVEAFVRLMRHWGDVEDPRPWLYATVANLVKDHWRRHGREAAAYERYVAGRPERRGLEVATPGPDHAEVMSVRDAVESLPERLRTPVLLHYYADLSVAQVARQVGKAEGTVKRDLHDARSRLARALEGAR